MMTKVMVVMFMWTYVTEGDDDGEDEGDDCDEVDDNNDDDGDGSSVGHGDPSTQYDNYVCIGRFYARGCAYINATKSIHARVWCVCVYVTVSSIVQVHSHKRTSTFCVSTRQPCFHYALILLKDHWQPMNIIIVYYGF